MDSVGTFFYFYIASLSILQVAYAPSATFPNSEMQQRPRGSYNKSGCCINDVGRFIRSTARVSRRIRRPYEIDMSAHERGSFTQVRFLRCGWQIVIYSTVYSPLYPCVFVFTRQARSHKLRYKLPPSRSAIFISDRNAAAQS